MRGCRFSSLSTFSILVSSTQWRRYSDICAAKNWISGNELYKRHPRLQSLEACGNFPWLLLPVMAYVVVSGLIQNTFVASRVLHFCCSGSLPDLSLATVVFGQTQRPNLFSWNTIIKSFAKSEDHPPFTAFSFYSQMLHKGVLPDKHTFPFLLMACKSSSTARSGRLLHCHSLVLGFSTDTFVQTALVNMYLRSEDCINARLLFERMTSRDVVSWTGLISGLVAASDPEQALQVFKAMRNDPMVKPTVPTMVSTMAAFSDLGALNQTRALHGLLEKTGFVADIFIGNSLITGYAKCGAVISSSKIFHDMKDRDLLSWTAIVSGFASNGMSQEALSTFADMTAAGILPDQVTFLAVLSACSHAGLIEEGVENFKLMQRKYKLLPEVKHYGCMVDLFARAGLLRSAWQLVSAMPVKPSLAVLGALLSACRAQRELELAEVVTRMIVYSCKGVSGTTAMLSGMYADECRWEDASMVRKVGGEEGVRKHTGQSWIEVGGIVYRFVVQDGKKPYLKEIVSSLDGFARDGRS